jgi:hypothetical protein
MSGDDAALAFEHPEDATSSLANELPAGQCVTRAARHRWRSRLSSTLATAVLVMALSVPPLAHADPPDPHIPNPLTGYCPGGGAGNVFEGYCDGEHYPDGSYWHQLMAGGLGFPWLMPGATQPTNFGLSCVVDPDNGPVPQPAPPGRCGGAVK